MLGLFKRFLSYLNDKVNSKPSEKNPILDGQCKPVDLDVKVSVSENFEEMNKFYSSRYKDNKMEPASFSAQDCAEDEVKTTKDKPDYYGGLN